MKTTLQKLVVSLLVLVMFLTSNGTLVLAAEINDVVDTNNETAIENVTEALETNEITQVNTNEDEPDEGLTNEQDQLVVEEKEDVEENVAVEEKEDVEENVAVKETENVEENVLTESTIETEVNTNDTIDVNESVETIEENTTIVETKNETIFNEDTITFTGKANNVDVKVVAQPGTFPVGTTMVVTPVEKTEVINAVEAIMKDEVNDVKAVDITFYANGKEVEPNKNVNVELNTSALKAKKDLNVVHIQDSGKIEVMDLTKASKTTTEFKAESFSVYVVVKTGEDARLKVKFMNGSSEIASMYVKEGDNLEQVIYDPGVGKLADDVYFQGWTQNADYTVAENGTITPAAKTIADVRTEVSGKLPPAQDGDTLIYHAVLTKKVKIDYLNELGVSLGSEEKAYRADLENPSFSYTVNMSYTPQDTEHNFEGWVVSEGGEYISGHTNGKVYKNETKITVSGSVTFSVDAPEGHWLVFNENGTGATYNAPRFFESNEKVTEVPTTTMERFGYTFGGWYKDKDCTESFTTGQILESNTTIYAKWTPVATAGYTILIWKQNVDGETYDFAESISLTGNVESTINTVTSTGNGDGRYARVNGTAKSYAGFHLDRYDTNVQIVPEGTAVLNVYYNRNTVTLTFVHFEYRQSGWSGEWELVTDQTMTGLYGQTLASKGYTWPTNRWWYDSYQQGYGGYSGAGTRTTFLDAFILSDDSSSQTFYGFAGNGNNNVHFLKQNADGNGYTEDINVTTSNGTFYISDKYNGFKAAQYSTNNRTWTDLGDKNENGYYGTVSNYTNLYIRFDRLKYNILYMDGVYVDVNNKPVEGYESRGQLNVVNNIVYESNISSYNKGGANYYAPTYANFVFAGWYIDEACQQPYTFTTMPVGITVYAKWIQTQYRVFLHPNAGTSETEPTLTWGKDEQGNNVNQAMNFRVSAGKTVSAPTGQRDDYEFVGWYLDENFTQIFNADNYILYDTTVTTPYDKTKAENYTDPMDNWGNGATWNSDIIGNNGSDRFWITKKLDIYANWRAKLPGANGIGVQYEYETDTAGTTAIIVDGNGERFYVDGANANGIPAPTTAPKGKVFDHWVLQTWNGEKYVDTDPKTIVFPGETFTVLKSNAKSVITEWVNPNNHNDVSTQQDATHTEISKATYTVQLKAVYKPAEEATPTHIYWYQNDGKTKGPIHTDPEGTNTLAINEAVNIQSAPSRDGYKFKGWAKYAETEDFDYANFTPNITDADLFLTYENNAFKDANGNVATQVAADENTPVEALIAMWEAKTDTPYTVEYYYQENGTYKTTADSSVERTGTTDTTANVTEDDVTPTKNGYVLDESDAAGNVFTGIVKGDGSLVLKVHFKQQFTVEYKKGNHGTFTETKTENIDYGTATPAAPKTTGEAGYTFNGWSPEVADTVTANATYVAQWKANTDTKYKVEHYTEKLDGSYELRDTDYKTGTTDTEAVAEPKEYPGFKFDNTVEGTVERGNIAGDGSLVLKLYYTRNSYKYTVEYYFDNVHDEALDENGSAKFESEVSRDPAKSMKHDNKNYVLVSKNHKIEKISLKPEENIIKVYYELDELNDDPEGPDTPTGGDEIPDKYQICVYYNVENGAWDEIEDNKETTDKDESRAQVLDVVTLKLDNEPSTDENAEGELEVPVVGGKPDKGFCAGEWDKEVPKTVKKSADKTEYTYKYLEDNLNDDPEGPDTPTGGDEIPDKYQICVYYNVENGAWDEIEDNKETTDKDESRAQVLDVVTLKLDNEPSTDENAEGELEVPVVGGKPDKGFCAGEWDKEVPKTVKKSADKTEYTYTYLEDNLNDDPEGPDTPTGGDGIPDKYQIVINYEVENGAWDDTTTEPKLDVVTLYKGGELSDADDAEGKIEIPEVGHEPNVGYWTGDWNITLPKMVKKADNGNIYVYTYVICTPTQDDPPVKKVIFGDEPATSEIFKFTLSAISNTAGFDVMPMPEGSNGQSKTVQIKGAGEYEFGIIEFTMPGTYIYKIIEEDTGNEDYVYDESIYEVIYVVSQNEDKLECVRTMKRDGKQTDQDAVFMNKYTAPVANIEVSENPRTGDSIYLYIVMLVISTFGIVISSIENPKRRKNYSK